MKGLHTVSIRICHRIYRLSHILCVGLFIGLSVVDFPCHIVRLGVLVVRGHTISPHRGVEGLCTDVHSTYIIHCYDLLLRHWVGVVLVLCMYTHTECNTKYTCTFYVHQRL